MRKLFSSTSLNKQKENYKLIGNFNKPPFYLLFLTFLTMLTFYLSLILWFCVTFANASNHKHKQHTNATKTEDPVYKMTAVDYYQTSPVWLADVKGPDNVVKGYPRDEDIQSGPLTGYNFKLDMNAYPEPGKQPPVNHPEVQEVLKHLDFEKIPQSKTRVVKDWVLDLSGYDTTKDPDCWWSASLCKKPKLSYIPEDISYCPNKGDWGLNYDDGPYKIWYPNSEEDKDFDQPRFYNFLVDKGKQKATLFCKLSKKNFRTLAHM